VFNSRVRVKRGICGHSRGRRLGGIGNWVGEKPLGCPEDLTRSETVLCYLTREHGVDLCPVMLSSSFFRA